MKHLGGKDLVREATFDESWGKGRTCQFTEEPGKRLEDDDGEELPVIDFQMLRGHFGDDEARQILTYLQREGIGGQVKKSVADLAREHGVDRTTIWRWCKAGKAIIHARAKP